MKLNERIELLRRNPVFFSALGGMAPIPEETEDGAVALLEDISEHIGYHKDLANNSGIKIHSSTLPLGWLGVNRYDYRTTDKIVDELFAKVPDALYLPRIHLDVPLDWCAKYPEEVFVYSNGPRTAAEVKDLVGTLQHDYCGTDSDTRLDAANLKRINKDGVIARQSFSSKQWLNDAGEALRRLVVHLEEKYGDKIVGYHLGYGNCGETTNWGTWLLPIQRKGDFGISNTKNFIEYAKKHGKTYDRVPSAQERYRSWYDLGHSLREMFFDGEEQEICVEYSKFASDVNVDAIEHFCKVVKEINPDKPTGVFYGYIIEVSNVSHAGHLAIDKLLNLSSLDFVSSPKGYVNIEPNKPGLGQSPYASISRKKLYLDEIDNRTHVGRNAEDHWRSKDMAQTRGVYWREFSKNVQYNQGYWWMDLCGGWLDDAEIQSEIKKLGETVDRLYKKPYNRKKECEVLLVVDEQSYHYVQEKNDYGVWQLSVSGATYKHCGTPIDLYRYSDLKEMELDHYKVIVFMNQFRFDEKEMETILAKTSPDCHIIWNHAPGILNGGFDLKNIERVTGFPVSELGRFVPLVSGQRHRFPLTKVEETSNIIVLKRYQNGDVMLAKRKAENGRTYIFNATSYELSVEEIRSLYEDAGVHFYAPAYCTVNCDNRFLYVIAGKDMSLTVRFQKQISCENVFTGEKYSNVKEIPMELKEGNGAFFLYEE